MTTQTPFQDASEQPGWEGVTLQPSGSNTQSQAFPFLPSAFDSVFVPVNNGCFSQPQIFAPNPVPFNNNTAYNQLPNSPIIQHSYIPNNFIHDRPLHFPLSSTHQRSLKTEFEIPVQTKWALKQIIKYQSALKKSEFEILSNLI